jgi:hypothetical protein
MLQDFSIGIAAFLLIWLYVENERNYDRFHKDVNVCPRSLGIIVVTLLTISFQTIKASLTNPADTLRTE